MGADVIKIEPPGGDSTRRMAGATGTDSPSFNAVNRGKRGIVLDLKSAAGQDAFRRLAARSDVVIENYRPGVMRRFGLDYESLSRTHPELIYASISGYGQAGPAAQKGGFDLVAQGVCGIMSVTGEPGGAPVKAGVPVTDLGAGLFALSAILAALFHRERTGRGQHIDTSLVEAVRCANGYITLAAANDRLFERLCTVLGHPDWARRPEFSSDTERVRNRAALAALIESETTTRSREEWLALFEANDLPCGPINNYQQVFADPQVRAREMVLEVEHPTLGRLRTLGSPVKMSATPPNPRRRAPRLGEHTREVLLEAGWSEAELARVLG
jgi:formyl-CoA transferase